MLDGSRPSSASPACKGAKTHGIVSSVTLSPCHQAKIRQIFQKLSIALFCLYLALFPGSTLTVALDRVPAWGAWMGGALLMLQGAIVLCWLLGSYGRRGAVAGLLVLLLAWAVEHVGATTGAPFGRYHYTQALQPQLLGVVPLAIACAWLMVAVGAWQFATDSRFWILDFGFWKESSQYNPQSKIQNSLLAATLIVLLDLQIETVATAVNRYWVWSSDGPYYGVPMANFVSWWLLGAGMASLLTWVLRRHGDTETRRHGDTETRSGVRGQGSGVRGQGSGVRGQGSDSGESQTQNSKLKTQNSPLPHPGVSLHPQHRHVHGRQPGARLWCGGGCWRRGAAAGGAQGLGRSPGCGRRTRSASNTRLTPGRPRSSAR